MYQTLIILILIIGGIGSLSSAAFFLKRNMKEQAEIESRFMDLEVATNGYCRGELNGAYNRILKRQKKRNERKTTKRTG